MPTYRRTKKRAVYLLARTNAGNRAEEVGEFAPLAASVPASNNTNTSALGLAPAPVILPLSTTHLIPSSSFRIAGGPHTREWCFHPVQYLPLRRLAVACSILQQPSQRSFVRKSRRLTRPVRQTFSGVYDFLANIHFTLPDLRPLSSFSTHPLNAKEDTEVVDSDHESVLNSEFDYCDCDGSMHVHDSVDEAEVESEGSNDNGVSTCESAETYTVVFSNKAFDTEIVRSENDWHIDAFLEAVGAAARDSVQQVKGEKQRRLDAYLVAVGDTADAENELIEVYYCSAPSLPVPCLNGPPRAPALYRYPDTPSPTRPMSLALGPPVHFASTSRPSIPDLGFPGQSARAVPQVRLAASPSPSLLASEQSYGRTSVESYNRASFESYASGYTTGYAADASNDESNFPSSSFFSSSSSSSSGASVSSSVVTALSADDPRENQMLPTSYDSAMRPTFLPHVMSSVSTTREPSPARSGRCSIAVDTRPSSQGLGIMAKQPAYAHPSLRPSVRTVYEIRNGKPDKRMWKKPKSPSERKRKRRFLNRFTRMFSGYQNADPIDVQPSRDRGRGNKIPCLDGWMTSNRAESAKRADTPMPSVIGTNSNQSASNSSKATTVTTSPSSKKTSDSGFSLFGLLKKNKDRKKDKEKRKSTYSSPKLFSSRLWSSSSSRAPVVWSFEGPTLCRPILSLPNVKQEAPLTAMEINALLSALVPDTALPPVQHCDTRAHITSATPQRVFSSVPTSMAPTRALKSSPTDQRALKVPHSNFVSHTGARAGNSPVVMPTTPVLKPMSPPVQDVPILTLEPSTPRFVSIEQVLDLTPVCMPEEKDEDNDVQSDGAAQVVSMKIFYDVDEEDEDDDPDYWYNAYAENPNPIPIIKNKRLERSLRSYHPGNRNSRLEMSKLPACLLAGDDSIGLDDGGCTFEDRTVLSSTTNKGKVVYNGTPGPETWRLFSPGKPPLNTVQEAATDEEADDEFSTLASTEYAGSSSSDDPEEVDLLDKLLLEDVIRVYGQVVVNAALVAAHATGTKFDIHELILVLEQNFDPGMFKNGYDLPEKNTAPGSRCPVGGEQQGSEGSGGKGGRRGGGS
ncbi:hypothetical protein BGZ81_009644 [Podila clonocystis]|nr:hypothetical protein BGZ81_009644 [Podila clonocystis]